MFLCFCVLFLAMLTFEQKFHMCLVSSLPLSFLPGYLLAMALDPYHSFAQESSTI